MMRTKSNDEIESNDESRDLASDDDVVDVDVPPRILAMWCAGTPATIPTAAVCPDLLSETLERPVPGTSLLAIPSALPKSG